MYTITNYTRKQAKKLGVTIKHSTNTKKKIDVFKKGKKVCSVGNLNYYDFPTFVQKRGISFAKFRRRLYKKSSLSILSLFFTYSPIFIQ